MGEIETGIVYPARQSAAITTLKLFYSPVERRRLIGSLLVGVQTLLVPLAALTWFVLSFAAIIWMQHGTNPRYFSSPDETIQRHAAQLVADHGRPFDSVQQSDPEDLLHERLWITIGDHAVPAYPPTAYYIQGALLKVPFIGYLVIPALSALALAALVAGVAGFSPSRKAFAALAPLLAFPALYYLMRPWLNIATMLSFICLALFFWSRWTQSRSRRSLVAAAIMIALAMATRPDYALFLLSIAIAAAWAEGHAQERRRLLIAISAAGSCAITINLVLNAVTIGHPFSTAYAIWDTRNGISRPWMGAPGPLSDIGYAIAPYGLPAPRELIHQVGLYWLHLGPMAFVLLGQLALVPLLIEQSGHRRRAYAAIVVLCVIFIVTHVSADVFGADDNSALLRDSLTRYWTPVYLLAGLPPLIFVMRARREWIGVGLVLVVALLGGRTLLNGQPESMESMQTLYATRSAEVDAWRTIVPADAVVFTVNLDKLVWSQWDTATLPGSGDQAPTATAMKRTIGGGRPVYVIQGGMPASLRSQLDTALHSEGLQLEAEGSDGQVFMVSSSAGS